MLNRKKKITIIQNEEEFSFYMYPLKIKHLDNIDDLVEAVEEQDNDKTISIFLKLFSETIDIDLDMLNEKCLDDLIKIFIDFNFDKVNIKNKNKNNKKREDELYRSIEFLISEGHRFADILEYSIFQFAKFVELAVDRKTGYKNNKKSNPIEALKKIGVKVHNG